jgi:hypothetical protein
LNFAEAVVAFPPGGAATQETNKSDWRTSEEFVRSARLSSDIKFEEEET